ncbi:MAG: hypothetical protein AAF212_03755 [Verrucomicrobiota bacterium]
MKTTARPILTLLFSVLCLGNSAVHAELTADAVIERLIEASGGEATIKALRTMEATFLVEMPGAGLSFQSKLISKHPGMIYLEQVIPGAGSIKQGYNGIIGWSSDPIQGDRELTEGEIEELSRDAGPQGSLQLKEKYPIRSVISETDTEVALSLQKSSDSAAEKWVFSKKTGLLTSVEAISDMGPLGQLPLKMFFSDYEKIKGLVMPRVTEVENPGIKIKMVLQDFASNTEVDPKIFDPPF